MTLPFGSVESSPGTGVKSSEPVYILHALATLIVLTVERVGCIATCSSRFTGGVRANEATDQIFLLRCQVHELKTYLSQLQGADGKTAFHFKI